MALLVRPEQRTIYARAPQAPPQTPSPFEPTIGQAGKDVVWVPTPEVLVERMLDLAGVGPSDVVVDLGSGDGRNVIAAARRGARARGVEFNPAMVELSRLRAREAGVEARVTFVQGDMYEADISDATVLALFLLPNNMSRLAPKFVALAPGTRIVSNTFGIEGWTPDQTEEMHGECTSWCTALLWVVPARAAGTWNGSSGQSLELTQAFQMITGRMVINGREFALSGRVRGENIRMSGETVELTGRVQGDMLHGTLRHDGRQEPWSATRLP